MPRLAAMAERGSGKAKPKARPSGDDASVLASLSTTRPQRLGNRRRTTAAKAKPAAKKRAPAKPRASAKRRPKPVTRPTAISEASGHKPKPVRSGASGLDAPAKKAAVQRSPAPERKPSGVELVGTVVQAAGELAQVGLSIGGQVLKRAVERLPKP